MVELARTGFLCHTLVFDEGRTLSLDYTDLPCPRLVRHLSAALCSIVGVGGGHLTVGSGRAYGSAIRSFVPFIAARHPTAAAAFDARDLSAGDVDAYEEGLRQRFGSDSTSPYLLVGSVVRLLRALVRAGHVRLTPDLLARIDYVANGVKGRTTPRDAYSPGETARLRTACRAEVLAVVERITVTGPRTLAEGGEPSGAGWRVAENVLRHMAEHGPMSRAELASRQDRKSPVFRIEPLHTLLYPAARDLVPFLVLFALESGIEIEACKELQTDCLGTARGGRVEVRYRKRRAGTNQWRTEWVRDNGIFSPGRLVRLALRLTERGRSRGTSTDLWLANFRTGFHRPSFTVTSGLFEDLVARSGLVGDNGETFGLQPVRLRKTHRAGRYLATQGQLTDFAGQSHSRTVAGDHYGAIEALRPVHEASVERGLRDALAVIGHRCRVVAPDEEQGVLSDPERGPAVLGVEPAEVASFLGGERDVWLSSCRDFFASPFGTAGSPCPVPFWGCLGCDNAVVTSRKLPAILAFLDHMLQARARTPAAEWHAVYGDAHQHVVEDVLPRFPVAVVAAARAAASDPAAAHLPPGLGVRP